MCFRCTSKARRSNRNEVAPFASVTATTAAVVSAAGSAGQGERVDVLAGEGQAANSGVESADQSVLKVSVVSVPTKEDTAASTLVAYLDGFAPAAPVDLDVSTASGGESQSQTATDTHVIDPTREAFLADMAGSMLPACASLEAEEAVSGNVRPIDSVVTREESLLVKRKADFPVEVSTGTSSDSAENYFVSD
jgi:uncharacterized ParB-like nuclease family protein